jgi:hypothetical protein
VTVLPMFVVGRRSSLSFSASNHMLIPHGSNTCVSLSAERVVRSCETCECKWRMCADRGLGSKDCSPLSTWCQCIGKLAINICEWQDYFLCKRFKIIHSCLLGKETSYIRLYILPEEPQGLLGLTPCLTPPLALCSLFLLELLGNLWVKDCSSRQSFILLPRSYKHQ